MFHYLNNALPALSALKAYDLEQQVHDHWTIHVSQNIRNCTIHGLQQVYHFLRFLVKQRLIDLGEIARLKRVKRGVALQELPEAA
jgi:N-glycosylase/DNA lyase